MYKLRYIRSLSVDSKILDLIGVEKPVDDFASKASHGLCIHNEFGVTSPKQG